MTRMMDRSIILSLRRKLPSEQAERLRHAEPGLFKQLAAKLARFQRIIQVKSCQQDLRLPDTLGDRAQDNWEPLLAIADIAQGDWPQLARNSSVKNFRRSGAIQKYRHGTFYLIFKTLLKHMSTDRITSADLIQKLCEDP